MPPRPEPRAPWRVTLPEVPCVWCGRRFVPKRRTFLAAPRLRNRWACNRRCAGAYGAARRWGHAPRQEG
jgi:hypothetical protein